jgi:hypothetical protein
VLDYFFFVCILASLSQFAHAMSFPGQYPAKATGLTTIYAPGGVQIRYKEPHICETTPGVRSYSGYVDLNAKAHMYVPFHHGLEPIAASWRNLFVFLCLFRARGGTWNVIAFGEDFLEQQLTQRRYFWFFESRNSPSTDPTTLWLSGGPGSASLHAALLGTLHPIQTLAQAHTF